MVAYIYIYIYTYVYVYIIYIYIYIYICDQTVMCVGYLYESTMLVSNWF